MAEAISERQRAWAGLGALVRDIERVLNAAVLLDQGYIDITNYEGQLARVKARVKDQATLLTVASFARYVATHPPRDTTFEERPRISGKWGGDRTHARQAKARERGRLFEPVRLQQAIISKPMFWLVEPGKVTR